MNVIVILNYNDSETTEWFVDNIREYESLDKILIVDNCSTDDSFVRLSKLADDKVEIIKSDGNNGYGSGNNFGIKYIEKKYEVSNIIISNPDIEVTNQCIVNCINYMNIHTDVAIVSGVIVDEDNTIASNFAWKVPSFSDLLLSNFLSVRKIIEKITKKSMYFSKKEINGEPLYVDAIPGCFFVANYDKFKEIEYFDEETFLFCEENILAYKLKQKKYKTVVLTDETIIHHNSVSIDKNIKKWKSKQKILLDSYIIYIKKYLKKNKFQIYLFDIAFNIGKYERKIMANLKRTFMKNQN